MTRTLPAAVRTARPALPHRPGRPDRPELRPRSAGPARRRRTGLRTGLGTLLVVAVVATAGAPSVITVRRGDTLWDLARAHGTTVSTLRALNRLPGNAMIYAGQTLQVPGGPSAAGAASQGLYRVRAGDTLSELALRFGTSVRALRAANRLSDSTIRSGQSLRIPGSSSPRAAGAPAAVPTTNAGATIPTSVRASAAAHRATLAARRVPSRSQVRQLVASTARRHGVPASLALAVAYHESGFQQRVVSPVDAIGVMQVLPRTGRVLSRQQGRTLNLLDTEDNITAGVLLLRQLLRATSTADGALAGYYQGLGSLARKGVLPQTRTYVRNINALRSRFANG